MSPAGKGNFCSVNLSLVHGHCLCTKALLDPHIDLAAAAENLLAHNMAHYASAQEENDRVYIVDNIAYVLHK